MQRIIIRYFEWQQGEGGKEGVHGNSAENGKGGYLKKEHNYDGMNVIITDPSMALELRSKITSLKIRIGTSVSE